MVNGILKLDWLSFTFISDNDEDLENGYTAFMSFYFRFPELTRYIDECIVMENKGVYDRLVAFNDYMRITFNESEHFINSKRVDMGVNVSIPSHALEWFFNCFGIELDTPDSICKMLTLLKERNCQCSRLDLCFDDYDKKFTPKYYATKFTDQKIATNYQRARLETSTSTGKGWTFYLGSRKAGKLLRIYDKEYESNGKYDCIRYEFEYHGRFAKDIMIFIINNKTINFFEYLLSWFRVTTGNCAERNKSDTDLEWFNYFSDKDRFNADMIIKVPRYTFDERKMAITEWLFTRCMNEIYGYINAFGPIKLIDEVKKNATKIPLKYRSLISQL